MAKLLFDVVVWVIALYVSYRLIESGNRYLKEALKIRKQLKNRERRNND